MRGEHDVPSKDVEERLREWLRAQLDERRYENWFGGGLTRLSVDGGTVVVAAASPYLLKWIQEQFSELLTRGVESLGSDPAQLAYRVDPKIRPERSGAAPTTAPRIRTAARTSVGPGAGRGRRGFELSRFVRGSCNELAWTAVQAVLERPGAAPSPIYLFGGVGCGKTHLLEGLSDALSHRQPTLRTLSLTAEDFANQFTQALDGRSLPSFRQRFRNLDLLCVDDVDFFDGKRVIQEEFLNTLRQLLRQERTLVFTADRHPRLLSRSSDELVSVLQSGLVCRIEAPDDAARKAIVRGLADRLKLQATSDALDYIAARFSRNVRELEGAVHFLCNWQQSTGDRATLAATRDALGALVRDCVRIIRLPDVEQAVCSFFNVQPDELRSARRERSVAAPRMLAMYLARRLTPAAYSAIGEYFGGRNHSTVMAAERKIEASLQSRAPVRVGSQNWTMTDIVAALEQRLAAI